MSAKIKYLRKKCTHQFMMDQKTLLSVFVPCSLLKASKNVFLFCVCTRFEILKHKKQKDQCKDFPVYLQDINNSKAQNKNKSQAQL